MGSKHRGEYSTVVSADDADEAVTIATEALPPGAEVTDARAKPSEDGPMDSWQVTLHFRGRKKIKEEKAGP